MGCLKGNEMGLNGLFGKWIKRKRNGLGKTEGSSSRSWEKGGGDTVENLTSPEL